MIPQMSGKATNEILREIHKQSRFISKNKNKFYVKKTSSFYNNDCFTFLKR